MLVRLDRLEPDRLEVVDRRAEPDRLGHRRRARLELRAAARPRSSARRRPADHVAAEQERLHRAQQLGAPPEEADPARAAHLVPGDGDEVGAERLDVEPDVRRRLRAVADEDRAARVRPRGEPLDVSLIVPSELETMFGRDDLHVLDVRRASSSSELAVVVDRDDPERRRPCGSRRTARARSSSGARARSRARRRPGRGSCEPLGVRDQVERLRRVADEDDLAVDGAFDERAHLLARAFERRPSRARRARRRRGARSRTTSRRTRSSRRAPDAASASVAAESRYASGFPLNVCSKMGKSARSLARVERRLSLDSHRATVAAAYSRGRFGRVTW